MSEGTPEPRLGGDVLDRVDAAKRCVGAPPNRSQLADTQRLFALLN